MAKEKPVEKSEQASVVPPPAPPVKEQIPAAFGELLASDLPHDKIAEIAGVSIDTVMLARAGAAGKAEEIINLTTAAQQLLQEGWELKDGKLVPPVTQPLPPLKIRLKRKVTYLGYGKKGNRVTLDLAPSIYRDDMARKVIQLVTEAGHADALTDQLDATKD